MVGLVPRLSGSTQIASGKRSSWSCVTRPSTTFRPNRRIQWKRRTSRHPHRNAEPVLVPVIQTRKTASGTNHLASTPQNEPDSRGRVGATHAPRRASTRTSRKPACSAITALPIPPAAPTPWISMVNQSCLLSPSSHPRQQRSLKQPQAEASARHAPPPRSHSSATGPRCHESPQPP